MTLNTWLERWRRQECTRRPRHGAGRVGALRLAGSAGATPRRHLGAGGGAAHGACPGGGGESRGRSGRRRPAQRRRRGGPAHDAPLRVRLADGRAARPRPAARRGDDEVAGHARREAGDDTAVFPDASRSRPDAGRAGWPAILLAADGTSDAGDDADRLERGVLRPGRRDRRGLPGRPRAGPPRGPGPAAGPSDAAGAEPPPSDRGWSAGSSGRRSSIGPGPNASPGCHSRRASSPPR